MHTHEADLEFDLGQPREEGLSYAVRQRQRDTAYRRDYDRWVNSLTPQERRQLAQVS